MNHERLLWASAPSPRRLDVPQLHRNWLGHATLSRLPSEYFRANVSVTFHDDWVAFQTTHLVNHERLLWASDHPHVDSTFPNSQRVLAEQTAHLDVDVRDDIVWRNFRTPLQPRRRAG